MFLACTNKLFVWNTQFASPLVWRAEKETSKASSQIAYCNSHRLFFCLYFKHHHKCDYTRQLSFFTISSHNFLIISLHLIYVFKAKPFAPRDVGQKEGSAFTCRFVLGVTLNFEFHCLKLSLAFKNLASIECHFGHMRVGRLSPRSAKHAAPINLSRRAAESRCTQCLRAMFLTFRSPSLSAYTFKCCSFGIECAFNP